MFTTVRPLDGRVVDLAAIVSQFCDRYPNRTTGRDYWRKINQLFRETGARHPAELDEDTLVKWCAGWTSKLANNTVRQRATQVHTFYAWCLRKGYVSDDPSTALVGSQSLLRHIPRTFGKVQGKNPARWLNHDQAYGALVGACRDDTERGLRDEIVLRLTLAGMRAGECAALTVGDVRLADRTITWIGKGRKPRAMTPGTNLSAALRHYLDVYESRVGRPLLPADPLIAPAMGSNHAQGRLRFGHAASYPTIFRIVQRRAAAADLGHVAPHDMRRTTAKLLHEQTDNGGAHMFDLRDIQQVLDHASPSTTVKYLDALDAMTVRSRAASVLD